MRRNIARVMSGGEPVTWLGANFWSRTGGPLMWRHYDPAVIGQPPRPAGAALWLNYTGLAFRGLCWDASRHTSGTRPGRIRDASRTRAGYA